MTAWQRSRPKKVAVTQYSSRRDRGYFLSAEIDQYGARWHVQGTLAGLSCVLLGSLPEGSSLEFVEAEAERALETAIAAGLEGR